MALNLRGISNSTSTLNASTLIFLNNMGYCAPLRSPTLPAHWAKYAGGTPVNTTVTYPAQITTTTRMPVIMWENAIIEKGGA
jgi:hypothetical protein